MRSSTAAAARAPVDEIIGGHGLSNEDAQLVEALVSTILREKGRLPTKELLAEVVTRSKPRSSVTHHLFEWDQAKGHALYLLERARQLIMRVQVVLVEAPEDPVRAFPIVFREGTRGPEPMRRVLDNRDMMASLLEAARAELERWRRKYGQLRQLAEMRGVFEAVDKATTRKQK